MTRFLPDTPALTFALLLLLCNMAGADVRAPDSAAPQYIASLQRIPFPDAIITSETFVRFREIPGQDSVDREYLDVHTVQVGDTQYRSGAQRVAIQGIISSYDNAANERVASEALARTIIDRLPAQGDRMRVSGIISSEEMRQRFGLTGVVTSDQEVIQMAFLRRETAQPDEAMDADIVPSDVIDMNEVSPEVVAERERRSWLRLVRPAVASYVRADDIRRDDGSSEATTIAVVVPRFNMAYQQGRWAARGHVEMEFGEYIEGDRDNFINNEVVANLRYNLNAKNQLRLGGVYRDWTDKRSLQAIEDFNAQLLGTYSYRANIGDLTWEYGSEESRVRSIANIYFENSLAVGNAADNGYDLDHMRFGWSGFYRVSKRLSYVVTTQYHDYDYVEREDSREVSILPGVEYWPSRRLKTKSLIGYGRKQHPADREWVEALLWDVNASWRPRRRTTFAFATRREFLEVFERDGELLVGEFGLQQYITGSWGQKWTPLWDSELSVTYQQRKFQEDFREEDALQFIFRSDYQLSPRLTIGADGVYTTQESQASENYQRWTVTLRADYQL